MRFVIDSATDTILKKLSYIVCISQVPGEIDNVEFWCLGNNIIASSILILVLSVLAERFYF